MGWLTFKLESSAIIALDVFALCVWGWAKVSFWKSCRSIPFPKLFPSSGKHWWDFVLKIFILFLLEPYFESDLAQISSEELGFLVSIWLSSKIDSLSLSAIYLLFASRAWCNSFKYFSEDSNSENWESLDLTALLSSMRSSNYFLKAASIWFLYF